jgi:GNAT superfamily N-acetyltransferase
MRGKGIGKALLVNLAQRCVAEGLGRFEWWVLDWNEPSIEFYKSQGGTMQDEWTKVRIDGEALTKLGSP